MNKIVLILTIFLITFLMVLGWTSLPADESGEIRASEEQRQLRALEEQILTFADPTSESYENLLDALTNLVRKQMTLRVGDSTYEAAEIYFCQELSEDCELQCVLNYADDTAHLTEFPELYTPVGLDSQDIALQIAPVLQNDDLAVYLGDPDAMHDSDCPRVRELIISEKGALALKPDEIQQESVLFAIAKGESDLLYKKYVWVIRQ
jgi:hypothetical protein